MFDLSGIKIVQSEAVPKGKIVFMGHTESHCPYSPNSGVPYYEQPGWLACRAKEIAANSIVLENVGDERREGQR